MTRQSQQTKTHGSSLFGGIFGLLVVLGLVGILAYNKLGLVDWWRLRNYIAPETIATYATQDTMTPFARKVLYVNNPLLQAKPDFKNCEIKEQAAILGCYHSNQAGIFLLDVNDARLEGIEQVTIAHEMLHAAYDRLNSGQKKSIDALLLDYYNNELNDIAIQKQIDAYKKSEPNEIVNEMHSIFGTEVEALPAALELYYKKYFTNRSKVVGFYNMYQAEFTSRQETVKQDDAKLAVLKQQITAQEAELKTKGDALRAMQQQLDAYKAERNITAYNTGVPSFNKAVGIYNLGVQELKNSINQYNDLVAARNAVAAETQALSEEITSQVAPIK